MDHLASTRSQMNTIQKLVQGSKHFIDMTLLDELEREGFFQRLRGN